MSVVDDVIDSENSVFLNAVGSNNNEETSVIRLNSIEDSLEIESKRKFSSTSSEDCKENNEETL